MNPSLAIVLVVAVAALAWWLRRGSQPAETALPSPSAESPEEEEEEDEAAENLAITSDGAVFIPIGSSVRLVHVDRAMYDEEIEAGIARVGVRERVALDATRGGPGSLLSAGDFTGARIRRGAVDVVPWMLETLGRDGEYIPFPFETEEGARAALALLQKRKIVRRPLDDEGRSIPASPEDFEEARRRYMESWNALAVEREPGEDPGPPYSDRR
jgi:hypothetical protein